MMHWFLLIFHNWKAKLGALALATAVWLVIRHSIGYPAAAVLPPSPVPVGATPHD